MGGLDAEGGRPQRSKSLICEQARPKLSEALPCVSYFIVNDTGKALD